MHCTALHCTALHCTVLHCTALPFECNAVSKCPPLRWRCPLMRRLAPIRNREEPQPAIAALYCTVIYSILCILHWTAMHCLVIPCIVLLNCNILYFTEIQLTAMHYVFNTAQFYTKFVQCHNWSKNIRKPSKNHWVREHAHTKHCQVEIQKEYFRTSFSNHRENS